MDVLAGLGAALCLAQPAFSPNVAVATISGDVINMEVKTKDKDLQVANFPIVTMFLAVAIPTIIIMVIFTAF